MTANPSITVQKMWIHVYITFNHFTSVNGAHDIDFEARIFILSLISPKSEIIALEYFGSLDLPINGVRQYLWLHFRVLLCEQ